MNKRQKKKRIRIRNRKLVERYPFLLPRNAWTGEVVKGYDYSFTEYNCIDEGWQRGFGKFLLEDIRDACLKTNFLDKLRFSQIKEKYGSLRMYDCGAPQEVRDVLQAYEFISQYVCIECGSPYACIVDNCGWDLPLCEHCFEKKNARRAKPILWKDAVGDSVIGIPDEYRINVYSKGQEITETHDISKTTEKIRKKFDKRNK